ncbi:uncharacterized protein LOC129614374 [Condylostylus longicornis]|uniref:uncharacterized protein LOC129614374 n=1 Tax=Condylostylus longicornis TaxID=2530218 RepID=UPI00244E24B4|nr:uncharacterized protein LOC129614374 [Condylostylus longicornis]
MINQNIPDICPFLGIPTIINHNEKPKIVIPSNEIVTKSTVTEASAATTTATKTATEATQKNIEENHSVPSPMPTKSVAEPTTEKSNNKTTTITDNGTTPSTGTMSASGITVTFLFCFALFVGCMLVLLRNENVRSKIRGVLTRNSNSGVQYSRVRHEDAANLLLQNVPDDSDDENLL